MTKVCNFGDKLLVALALATTACTRPITFPGQTAVPNVHIPADFIPPKELADYVLAYCWQTPEKDNFGAKITRIVVSRGDSQLSEVVSYPVLPPQSAVSLGCYGQDYYYRVNQYGLAWRPVHSQLMAITSNTSVAGDSFFLIEVSDDLAVRTPTRAAWEHEAHFYNPGTVSWSPDGVWVATIGQGTSGNTLPNIWLYDLGRIEARRLTDYTELPINVGGITWSPDGLHVAFNYGDNWSGIGIVNVNDGTYHDISDNSQAALSDWPYASDKQKGLSMLTVTPEELLQLLFKNNSPPVWLDQGQQLVFCAPASKSRVALFMSDVEGTYVRELAPHLNGLFGLPRLSPDGKRIAFVRYPGWNERNRAEIGYIQLESYEVVSLAVIPAPSNNDELYISGLDWTPDGRYLAFSSNHEGQSDIIVLSVDGKSWINVTATRDGDAVNPIWRP